MKQLYHNFYNQCSKATQELIDGFILSYHENIKAQDYKKIIKNYELIGTQQSYEYNETIKTYTKTIKEKYFYITFKLRLGKIVNYSISFSFLHYLEDSLYIEQSFYYNIISKIYNLSISIRHDLSIKNDSLSFFGYDNRKDEFCSIIYQYNDSINKTELSYYINTIKLSHLEKEEIKKLSNNINLITFILDNYQNPEYIKDNLLITQDFDISSNLFLNSLYESFLSLSKVQI